MGDGAKALEQASSISEPAQCFRIYNGMQSQNLNPGLLIWLGQRCSTDFMDVNFFINEESAVPVQMRKPVRVMIIFLSTMP